MRDQRGMAELDEIIRVTRPLMPDRQTLDALIDGIFERRQFTNGGPLVTQLTRLLAEKLEIDHLQLVSSGASALQLALSAYDLSGSVVTTPFSFAASAHAIALCGLDPVFADIDPETLCLDPAAAEAAIQPDTSAILATHVFGMPCDVDRFEAIGKQHGVRIIYDAAAAFGTRLRGRSIMDWGDAATISFHATKPFHTVEGGGVVMRDTARSGRVGITKAHGIDGGKVPFIGPNARMSEVHAAFGLALLPDIDASMEAARLRFAKYKSALNNPRLRLIQPGDCDWNHAYCAVLFATPEMTTEAKTNLAAQSIDARRYFYPALNTLDIYPARSCPIGESVSQRVLCLPFGHDLSDATIERVAAELNRLA